MLYMVYIEGVDNDDIVIYKVCFLMNGYQLKCVSMLVMVVVMKVVMVLLSIVCRLNFVRLW